MQVKGSSLTHLPQLHSLLHKQKNRQINAELALGFTNTHLDTHHDECFHSISKIHVIHSHGCSLFFSPFPFFMVINHTTTFQDNYPSNSLILNDIYYLCGFEM